MALHCSTALPARSTTDLFAPVIAGACVQASFVLRAAPGWTSRGSVAGRKRGSVSAGAAHFLASAALLVPLRCSFARRLCAAPMMAPAVLHGRKAALDLWTARAPAAASGHSLRPLPQSTTAARRRGPTLTSTPRCVSASCRTLMRIACESGFQVNCVLRLPKRRSAAISPASEVVV